MRKLLIILSLFAIQGKLLGQILNVKESRYFFGIHAQTTFNVPFFASFYQLDSENKGWGVKGGYGRNNEVGFINYQGQISTQMGRTRYTLNSEYFYVTPQYIPYSKFKNKKLFVLAFGLPMGISKDKLEQKHENDPIRGDFYTYLKDENQYFGLEVELSYWNNIGKSMALKYGLITGMKLNGEAPFKEVFENNNRKFTYYPGMYRNIYLNFQIGILFSKVVPKAKN